MRAVVATDEGCIELSYMWLPTFIGMNHQLKKELESVLSDKLVGQPLTEEVLDTAHELVVDFLEKKFPATKGLRDVIDSLKYVYFEP